MKSLMIIGFLSIFSSLAFADDEVMVQIVDPFSKHKVEALEVMEGQSFGQGVSGVNKKVASVSEAGRAFVTTFKIISSDVVSEAKKDSLITKRASKVGKNVN